MIILAAYIQGRSIWTIVLVVAFTSWANRRSGDPQPGDDAAHSRIRTSAVFSVSDCSGSCSARSCRT